MVIVVDASDNVLMWSYTGSPEPPAGGQVIQLTPEQQAQFEARPYNTGMTFSNGQFTFNGG